MANNNTVLSQIFKLHVVADHTGDLPAFVSVTDGKVSTRGEKGKEAGTTEWKYCSDGVTLHAECSWYNVLNNKGILSMACHQRNTTSAQQRMRS